MIDPNSNDLILGSQLSRHHDLLPHLVRSERQGQAVIHHLNPPISPEGKLYTLSPEDQDLKIVFRAMSDGSGFYPYDVYNPQHISIGSDTLGATAGEYIVVPLRSTSATPYGFGSQQVFVANVIGSKDDPKPIAVNSWIDVIKSVLNLKKTSCQVKEDLIYDANNNTQVSAKDFATQKQATETRSSININTLVGGHVVQDSRNKTVSAGGTVYLMAIRQWLNILSYPITEKDWGTEFAMQTIPNAVGVKLSGYLCRG